LATGRAAQTRVFWNPKMKQQHAFQTVVFRRFLLQQSLASTPRLGNFFLALATSCANDWCTKLKRIKWVAALVKQQPAHLKVSRVPTSVPPDNRSRLSIGSRLHVAPTLLL
jgi:hypothetical protein